MNAAALLAQYERIADVPDAVARLRRFVLDLAVRGKLVPQDAAEEPAEHLLRRIAIEATRRIKAGEFRQPKALPPPEEPSYELPSSWRWSQIAEIGFISPRVDADDNLLASFVPMTLIAAEVGVRHQHEPRKWGDIKKGYTHFADGDVGLAKITPCFENGKSAVFRHLTGGVGSGTTELHVVRPVLVDAEYVLLFLKSPQFIETGIPRMTGTAGQKRVPATYFAYSPFPLPPLAEQHRIVAKVDELMALCDRLETARLQREATRDRLAAASLARLNTPDPETFQADARFAIGTALPALTTRPDQIKQLRQTILNLAVRGRLVPQDERDEAAAATLLGLTSGWSEQSAYALLATGNPELHLPALLPKGWASALVEHCFVVSGGIQKTPSRTAKANAFPYLGVGNVYRGRLSLDQVKQFELAEGELERYRLAPGDILIVEGNGSASEVGRCAVWRGEIENCVHQNHLIRCRPRNSSFTPYASLYLNSPDGMAAMKRLAITSAGLFSLSVGKIRKIWLPLPPLAEQHRIVAKADELMALCDQLEASLTHGENTRSRLLNALLHEALHPSHDNVVDMKAARQRLRDKREAVASRVVERMSRSKGRGRVRVVKALYFAEAHCRAALGGQWGRGDFGPYDHWILSFETSAVGAGWLTRTEHSTPDGGTRIEYKPGPRLSAKAQAAAQALGDQADEFERVLALLADLDSEESEIVATLYAAWNDLLLEGKPVSDDIVITEFREHWGVPRKASFQPARLRVWLDWMRKNQLIPKGHAPSTRHQAELI